MHKYKLDTVTNHINTNNQTEYHQLEEVNNYTAQQPGYKL
jgi:hypothetical protein